jgi:hypothetical protein
MGIAVFAETLQKTKTSDAYHPLKPKLHIETQLRELQHMSVQIEQ